MESKNLKGLFNLTRKEFKDVRKEIEVLQESVASLTVAVNGLKVGQESLGDKDEVLASLGRIEGLLRERNRRTEQLPEGNGTEKLGDRESALLRSLLQDSENLTATKDVPEFVVDTQDEQSTDRKTLTQESSRTSSLMGRTESQVPFHPAPASRIAQTKSFQYQTRDTVQETSETQLSSTGKPDARTAQVDQRLDAMSSQIEHLMEGQREMMAVLRNLAERDSTIAKSPVVVPPPRKVGRKVVGFVYGDESSDP